MVDLGLRGQSMLLENPVDLLLLAPHHIPVVGLRLLPLAGLQCLIHAIPEGSFEFDRVPALGRSYGGFG